MKQATNTITLKYSICKNPLITTEPMGQADKNTQCLLAVYSRINGLSYN